MDHGAVLEEGGVEEGRNLELYRGNLEWECIFWDSKIPVESPGQVLFVKDRKVLQPKDFDWLLAKTVWKNCFGEELRYN
jgi:hypothetical protein